MSQISAAVPIALAQGEGEARWFLGGLSTIKASGESTGGRVAVTENWAPRGHGSPLHVHRNEDEWFFVLSGELTFWVGGETVAAHAGSFVYGPRDVPHTFVVSSDEARFLLVIEPAGFEDFLRALSELAVGPTLPPSSVAPPPPEAMLAAAAEHGIEILGPPRHPGLTRTRSTSPGPEHVEPALSTRRARGTRRGVRLAYSEYGLPSGDARRVPEADADPGEHQDRPRVRRVAEV